ncbi:MAG: DUF1697 domain-containing protein [Paracoccaceae bacterium]
MTVWVALLRAVNVSGVNRLPMEEFRALLGGLGLEGARTYIQSGNAVFRSNLSGPVLSDRIADAILTRFRFRPPVLMLTADDLVAALAGCPFATEEGTKVHVFFAGRDLPRATGDFLKSLAAPGEAWGWRGRVLWLHLPDGLARSKLARRVMDLPVDMTARNLNTVRALEGLTAKVGQA